MFVYGFVVIVNIYYGNVYATYSNLSTSYTQTSICILDWSSWGKTYYINPSAVGHKT
jgi:hypothetical protein